MNRFMDTLIQVKLDGTYLKWIKSIATNKLLILDDFGLKPMDPDTRLTYWICWKIDMRKALYSLPHSFLLNRGTTTLMNLH